MATQVQLYMDTVFALCIIFVPLFAVAALTEPKKPSKKRFSPRP